MIRRASVVTGKLSILVWLPMVMPAAVSGAISTRRRGRERIRGSRGAARDRKATASGTRRICLRQGCADDASRRRQPTHVVDKQVPHLAARRRVAGPPFNLAGTGGADRPEARELGEDLAVVASRQRRDIALAQFAAKYCGGALRLRCRRRSCHVLLIGLTLRLTGIRMDSTRLDPFTRTGSACSR